MAVLGKVTGLHPVLVECLRATSDELGVNLTVISGRRSREEQAHWWNCYRNAYRTGVCRCTSCNPAFPPGQSWHEEDDWGYGQAVDVYVGGTALRNWPGGDKAARRQGLHAPFRTEPWHYQPVIRLGRPSVGSHEIPDQPIHLEDAMQTPPLAPNQQWKLTALVGPADAPKVFQPWMSAQSLNNESVSVEWEIRDTNGAQFAWSGQSGSAGNRCLAVDKGSPHAAPTLNIRDMAGRPDGSKGPRVLSCVFINRGPGIAVVTVLPDVRQPA